MLTCIPGKYGNERRLRVGLSKVLYHLRNLAPVILTINSSFQNGHDSQLDFRSVLSAPNFLTSCDKIVYGEKNMHAFGGGGGGWV